MGGIAAIVNWATGANDAPKEAAQIQANAATSASDLQYQQWLLTNNQLAPWRESGQGALSQLTSGMGQGGQFSTSPDQSMFNQFQTGPSQAQFAQFNTLPSTRGFNQFNTLPSTSGLDPYMTGKGPTLAELEMDPSYAWRKQQGIDALAASGAAAGNYGSGNMGVALQNYGQGLASTEYSNAYNRWRDLQQTSYGRQLDAYNMAMQGQNTLYGRNLDQYNIAMQGQNTLYGRATDTYNRDLGLQNTLYARAADTYNRGVGAQDTLYNRLAGLAGTGQTATQQTGQFGANAAANMGNFITQGGNAQAQGILGQAQYQQGMLNNMQNQATSGVGTYLNYQQQQQKLNLLQQMYQGGSQYPSQQYNDYQGYPDQGYGYSQDYGSTMYQ
jgi:hypothetical protein